MTTQTPDVELLRCPCGGAGHVAQFKMVRVPATFKACVSVYFCLNGCHREGVGMSEEQARDAWNYSIDPSTRAQSPADVRDDDTLWAVRNYAGAMEYYVDKGDAENDLREWKLYHKSNGTEEMYEVVVTRKQLPTNAKE